MRSIVILLAFLSGSVWGHQFTPTYPVLEYSFVKGVMKVEMELFNARQDVDYFELSVFDENWNSVAFATDSRIIPLSYLGKKNVTIYIREKDRYTAKYICSESKILSTKQSTVISSKICSKIR
jgi:hypothetical protein